MEDISKGGNMKTNGDPVKLSQGISPPGHSPTWRKQTLQCEKCGSDFEGRVASIEGEDQVFIKLCPGCWLKEQELEAIDRAKKELEKIKDDQRRVWYDECGVEGIFVEKTFENFERERQAKAYDAVKGYRDKSLVLLSPGIYGLGKTHLTCALANHLLETEEPAYFQPDSYSIIRGECPVLFITEPKLLSRIRQTFNRKYDDAETEEDVYSALAQFPLLIIDDVGKVRPRDYSFLQGVYFRIVDDRYVQEQHIILSTNLDYSELEEHIGGACADRLREMCGKNMVRMTGKSYRVNKSKGGKRE